MSRLAQAPSEGYVRLWQDDDGDWTWTYVEPDAELELRSNDSFPSREAARAAVELAYPDAEVWGPRPVERDTPEPVDRKREAMLLLLVLSALALLFWGLRRRNESRDD